MTTLLEAPLLAFLKRYIKDSSERDLRLSIWQGRIELHNAVLDVSALQSVLPCVVESASVVRVALTVPWTRLLDDSVVLAARGVRLALQLVAASSVPSVASSTPLALSSGGVATASASSAAEAASIFGSVKDRLRVELQDVEISMACASCAFVVHAHEILSFPVDSTGGGSSNNVMASGASSSSNGSDDLANNDNQGDASKGRPDGLASSASDNNNNNNNSNNVNSVNEAGAPNAADLTNRRGSLVADTPANGSWETADGVTRRIKLTNLTVRVKDDIIMRPVSVEAVISFEQSRVRFCSLTVLDELRLVLCDVHICLLKDFIRSITALFVAPSVGGGDGSNVAPVADLAEVAQALGSPPRTPSREVSASAPALLTPVHQKHVMDGEATPAASVVGGTDGVSTPSVSTVGTSSSPPPGTVSASGGAGSGSWTSSWWRYGLSWLTTSSSSAATPAASSNGVAATPGSTTTSTRSVSPQPVSPDWRTPAAYGRVDPGPSSPPSWFRFEVPFFALEVSRHVELVCPSHVVLAPRKLLRFSSHRTVVEMSYNASAIELMSRIDSVSIVDLWSEQTSAEGEGEERSVLSFDQSILSPVSAVCVDWVDRRTEKFVDVALEPFVIVPSPALVREVMLFVKTCTSDMLTEEGQVPVKQDAEKHEVPVGDGDFVVADDANANIDAVPTQLIVRLKRPRVRMMDWSALLDNHSSVPFFEVGLESLSYADSKVNVDGVRIVSGELNSAGTQLGSEDLSGVTTLLKPCSVVVVLGPNVVDVSIPSVSIAFHNKEMRGLLGLVTCSLEEFGADLPVYSLGSFFPVEGAAPVTSFDACAVLSRLVEKPPAPLASLSADAKKSQTQISVRRLSLLLYDGNRRPVVDVLADRVAVLLEGNGITTGTVQGLVCVNRTLGSANGHVVFSTISTSEELLLSSRAYAQMSDVAFAPDVIFESPAYVSASKRDFSRSESTASGATGSVRFTYTSSLSTLASCPDAMATSSLVLDCSRLRFNYDSSILEVLSSQINLGIIGLSGAESAALSRCSAAVLKWRYLAYRLQREKFRHVRKHGKRIVAATKEALQSACGGDKDDVGLAALRDWSSLRLFLEASGSNSTVRLSDVMLLVPGGGDSDVCLEVCIERLTRTSQLAAKGFPFDHVSGSVAVERAQVFVRPQSARTVRVLFGGNVATDQSEDSNRSYLVLDISANVKLSSRLNGPTQANVVADKISVDMKPQQVLQVVSFVRSTFLTRRDSSALRNQQAGTASVVADSPLPLSPSVKNVNTRDAKAVSSASAFELQFSVRSIRATLGEFSLDVRQLHVTSRDGAFEVSAQGGASVLHVPAERFLLSFLSAHVSVGNGKLAVPRAHVTGLRAVHFSESWTGLKNVLEPLLSAFAAPTGMGNDEAPRESKVAFVSPVHLSLEDACVSLPLGRQSALHFQVNTLKLEDRDVHFACLSVYFGPLNNVATVLGGKLKFVDSSVSWALTGEVDVVVSKVEAMFLPETDLEHVLFLATSVRDVPNSDPASAASTTNAQQQQQQQQQPASGGLSFRSCACHVLSFSFEADLQLVAQDFTYRRDGLSRFKRLNVSLHGAPLGEIGDVEYLDNAKSLSALVCDFRVAVTQVRTLKKVAKKMLACWSKVSSHGVPAHQVAPVSAASKSVGGSGKQGSDVGVGVVKASVKSHAPALPFSISIPRISFAAVLVPTDKVPIIEVDLEHISYLHREDMFRVRLLRGYVADLFALQASRLSFVDFREFSVSFAGSNVVDVVFGSPVRCHVTEPLMRAVAGVRSESVLPLFPIWVENATGYPVLLGDRVCKEDSVTGIGRDVAASVLQLLCDGHRWSSRVPVDFESVAGKKEIELESGDGDTCTLLVSRLEQGGSQFKLSSHIMVVNGTGLPVDVMHFRPYHALMAQYVFHEVIDCGNGARRAYFSSDKGKEDESSSSAVDVFMGDGLAKHGSSSAAAAAAAVVQHDPPETRLMGGDDVQPAAGAVHAVPLASATSKFRFRMRTLPSPWSVSVSVGQRGKTLVQCAVDVFLWCSAIIASSEKQVTFRLSPIAVLENHLPELRKGSGEPRLYWAASNGSNGVIAPAGGKAVYLGHPDDLNFGFSLMSKEDAASRIGKGGSPDCSKPKSSIVFSGLKLDVISFTVSFTRTRHVQVSAPVVLSNATTTPLLFGTLEVAAGATVPAKNIVFTVGNSEALPVQDWCESGGSQTVVGWADRDVTRQIILCAHRNRITRSVWITAKPVYSIRNRTPHPIVVLSRYGSLFVAAGESKSWDVFGDGVDAQSVPEVAFVRASNSGKSGSRQEPWSPEDVAAQLLPTMQLTFGARRLFDLQDDASDNVACISAKVQFLERDFSDVREDVDEVLARPLEVVLEDEAKRAPVLLRNETQWKIAVQEQFSNGSDQVVHSNQERSWFPSFWRQQMEQPQESLEAAVSRLSSKQAATADDADAKVGDEEGSGSAEDAPLFPLSVRRAPLAVRVRLEPDGNWSDYVDCSRSHFFSVPLYSQKGAQVVYISVSFVGWVKRVAVSKVAPPVLMTGSKVGTTGTMLKVSVPSVLAVRVCDFVEFLASNVSFTKRAALMDLSCQNFQLSNLIAGAVYPMMVFQAVRSNVNRSSSSPSSSSSQQHHQQHHSQAAQPQRFQQLPAFQVRVRESNMQSNHWSKLSVAFADTHVELDYGSLGALTARIRELVEIAVFPRMRRQQGAMEGKGSSKQRRKKTKGSSNCANDNNNNNNNNTGHHVHLDDWNRAGAGGAGSGRLLIDEIDLAPFALVLSWENPKSLIPVNVWDSVLSIRHLLLRMPELRHEGCAVSSSEAFGELLKNYLRDAFVGQTVKVLGSLDVVGNPTGLLSSFKATLSLTQRSMIAALEGNGQGMLDDASGALRMFARALLTPIVGISAATARIAGDSSSNNENADEDEVGRSAVMEAVKATLIQNRRTLSFVYDWLADVVPVEMKSPFEGGD